MLDVIAGNVQIAVTSLAFKYKVLKETNVSKK